MQTDSIRENLTKDDIIGIIEAELNADIERKINIILVEGSNDISFGENVFEQNVVFYESFAGKTGLKELIDVIVDNRVIAVRDKDYIDVNMLPDRMFVYDTSCLEMMLLKCEDVIRGFCNVYCKDAGVGREILYNAMRVLSPYSLARKKNEEQSLGIEFRPAFGDLIGKEATDFIKELFRRTGISDELRDQCIEEADRLNIDELYDITNGHDICKFLGCIAEDRKNKNLGEERVRKILICSYRKSDFIKTDLYLSVKSYQEQNGLKYVS